MDQKSVLAIDFGTSNTYITKCPIDKCSPVGIDFGEGRDGLATAILYREGNEPIIGDKALEEFGDATELERSKYKIRTQFKPDISLSKDADAYSQDFLKQLIIDCEHQHISLRPLQNRVIFGAPSESTDEFRQTLKAIALKAGFGSVSIIDEPKGAIFYHLQRMDITASEANQGTLVVDFGGGTCDFALVVRGEIKHSWGDMLLGGRLLDDLFFQWFLEQNPEALIKMQEDGSEFFVLWYLCRLVKEKFSQSMALDRTTVFRRVVGEFGRISNVTWDDFIKRAQTYSPSSTFSEYLQRVQSNSSGIVNAGVSIDILDWFRLSLRNGLLHEHVMKFNISCVILTGGSSSWSFVPDIIMEEMESIGILPRMLRSDRPYTTISQGLAIIPFLQNHYSNVIKEIESGVSPFIKDEIYPHVGERMTGAFSRIANNIAMSLFDQRITPILIEFRENGGSVNYLKERIANQSKIFEPDIKLIVNNEIESCLKALGADLNEMIVQWFSQYDLLFNKSSDEHVNSSDYSVVVGLQTIDVFEGIENAILFLAVGIASAIVAAICGGGGMALIMAGPLGWIIGLIIGAIVSLLTVTEGLEKAKEKAESWEGCSPWIYKKILTDNKIADMRSKIVLDIEEKVIPHAETIMKQLTVMVQNYVENEIRALSSINVHFR